MEITHRPRRLRRSEAIRTLVRETVLHPGDFIQPLFVIEGENICEPIESMPGQFRLSIDTLIEECKLLLDLGVPAVNLFGYSEDKDAQGSASYRSDGLIQRAISEIKLCVPDI